MLPESTSISVVTQMKLAFRKFILDESGATAIEYGLIAAAISIVIITVLGRIGTNLNAKFTTISNKLN